MWGRAWRTLRAHLSRGARPSSPRAAAPSRRCSWRSCETQMNGRHRGRSLPTRAREDARRLREHARRLRVPQQKGSDLRHAHARRGAQRGVEAAQQRVELTTLSPPEGSSISKPLYMVEIAARLRCRAPLAGPERRGLLCAFVRCVEAAGSQCRWGSGAEQVLGTSSRNKFSEQVLGTSSRNKF